MLVFLMGVLAGAATGVLSGFGVGGGTLLILYLTFVAGLDQAAAQGINLLYFLPTSLAALVTHWKRGYLPFKQVILPAAAAGCLTAAATSFLAGWMETDLLRRLFGAYLLVIGVVELVKKGKKSK